MPWNSKILAISAITILVVLFSCKEKVEITDGLRKVYTQSFMVGEIDECRYQGELVYIADPNAYDAGSGVFDKEGNPIGTCNYAWGPIDSLCSQLKDCKVIYRVKDHISGEPPVDKYGLGKK